MDGSRRGSGILELSDPIRTLHFPFVMGLFPEEFPLTTLEFPRVCANVFGSTTAQGGHKQRGQELCNSTEDVACKALLRIFLYESEDQTHAVSEVFACLSFTVHNSQTLHSLVSPHSSISKHTSRAISISGISSIHSTQSHLKPWSLITLHPSLNLTTLSKQHTRPIISQTYNHCLVTLRNRSLPNGAIKMNTSGDLTSMEISSVATYTCPLPCFEIFFGIFSTVHLVRLPTVLQNPHISIQTPSIHVAYFVGSHQMSFLCIEHGD
jgi:hypothetical protein